MENGNRLLLIVSLEIPSVRPTDGGGTERPPTGTGWDTLVAEGGPLTPLHFPAPLTLGNIEHKIEQQTIVTTL